MYFLYGTFAIILLVLAYKVTRWEEEDQTF